MEMSKHMKFQLVNMSLGVLAVVCIYTLPRPINAIAWASITSTQLGLFFLFMYKAFKEHHK
jgi:hypothetical protein